jgi:hypothetical protein
MSVFIVRHPNKTREIAGVYSTYELARHEADRLESVVHRWHRTRVEYQLFYSVEGPFTVDVEVTE